MHLWKPFCLRLGRKAGSFFAMAPKKSKKKPASKPRKGALGMSGGKSWKHGKTLVSQTSDDGQTVRKWVKVSGKKTRKKYHRPSKDMQLQRAQERAVKTMKYLKDEDFLTFLEERLTSSSVLREASIQCFLSHPDLFSLDQLTRVILNSKISPLQMFASCSFTDPNFFKTIAKALLRTEVLHEDDLKELLAFSRQRHPGGIVSPETVIERALGEDGFVEFKKVKTENDF